MIARNHKLILGLMLLLVLPLQAFTQGKLRFYNKNDSSQYIGFIGYAQFWFRHTENNPGTLVGSSERDHTTDLSMRRLRLATYGKINERTTVFMMLGRNDFNKTTDEAQIRLLDLTVDYQFRKWLGLGVGKNAWRGPGRYSAPLPSGFLGVDILVPGLTTVNLTDDLTRRLGVYAKGQISAFDYRLAFSKPYDIDRAGISTEPGFVPQSGYWQSSGYFKYQFMDKEAQIVPYSTGSYHGKKDILNLGIGFEHQPDLLWQLSGADTIYHNYLSYAVDIFYERPLFGKRNQVLTLYGLYTNFDYGPNYVRNIGLNSIASGVNENGVYNGKGNAFPVIGTGSTFLLNAALMVPSSQKKGAIMFQPYVSGQISNFDLLDEHMKYLDVGINILLNGHHSKFTLALQDRPIYDYRSDRIVVIDRKNTFILQYQFRID